MSEPVTLATGTNMDTLADRTIDDPRAESESLALNDGREDRMANSPGESLNAEFQGIEENHSITGTTESGNVNQQVWEDDNDVKECRSCLGRFNIFKRKHHCRKCGRIFCSQCCWKFCTYIPGSIVVESESYGGNRIIRDSYKYYEFRTCNSCFEEIRMLKIALGMSLDDENSDSAEEAEEDSSLANDSHESRPIIRDESSSSSMKQSQPRDITFESDAATVDDLSECPIYGMNLSQETEDVKENHISTCVRDQGFGSPHDGNFVGRRNHNRMLVYTLMNEPQCMDECVICLDDFHEGDKVARLECLCYFHNKCLKDWIKKKGCCECPVHSLTNE